MPFDRNLWARRQRAKFAAAGKCTACGKRPVNGRYKQCVACRQRCADANRKRQRQAIEDGICIECQGQQATQGQRCDACADAKRKRNLKLYRKRKAMNACVRCGQNAMAGKTRCADCAELENRDTYVNYWLRKYAESDSPDELLVRLARRMQ